MLARLYAAARLYVNFFQPSFKLKEKRREGAKTIKRYHAPAIPYERALAHPALPKAIRRKLRETHRNLDTVALLAEVRDAQAQLGERVDRRAGSPVDQAAEATAVAYFAEGLGKTWKSGEQQAIHRRSYVRRKPAPSAPRCWTHTLRVSKAGSPPNPTSRPSPLRAAFAKRGSAVSAISSSARSSASSGPGAQERRSC